MGSATNTTRYFYSYYFLTFFSFGALFPLLTVYLQEDVGLTGSQIGMIMSISPVVIYLCTTFVGSIQ